MDSDSMEDRLKAIRISSGDNVENANESMKEEVPKILNPAIRDAFRIFVNMLDIKSFIKLAMTSKEMYKRCMEIGFNINMKEIRVWNTDGSMKFLFPFLDMLRPNHDSFVVSLRKLTCKLNVRVLQMDEFDEPAISLESNAHEFLEEIGVNRIDELILTHYVDEWDAIISIIKDFGVKSVSIHRPVGNDILRSFLQLNLEKFCYHHNLVPIDFILKVDSPIRELSFPELRNISYEEHMEFLSKMMSGSLRRLTVAANAIDWRNIDQLPFDHEGPLPYARPLLLTRTPPYKHHEYWYLRLDGGITKIDEVGDTYALQISKCEPWEYPYILRKEDDVLKDLTEKRKRVSCSAAQFHTFSTSFTMINRFHEGPLPDCRPLYCKVTENHFWMLDASENLMKCTWEDGCAIWKAFVYQSEERVDHPALAKYIFWKLLKQADGNKVSNVHCNGLAEFDSWFNDIEKLDYDHCSVLPSARPLFFEKTSSEMEGMLIRVVLLDEDRVIECDYNSCNVGIRLCCQFNRHLNISFDVFRDSLELLKKSQKHLLISETSETEYWYQMDGAVGKAEWKEGRLSISKCELRESPPSFMKQAFKYFAKKCDCIPYTLEQEQLESCLEQFTVVPYDYSGPLTSDSPMAFVKKGIDHICCDYYGDYYGCECSTVFFDVCFLWDETLVTFCEWKSIPGIVYFTPDSTPTHVPPALKSEKFLKTLLQAKYDKMSEFRWFGPMIHFYLGDYMKLPFDYDGPLPEERPLLFENRSGKLHPICFLLREDGSVIRIQWESYVSLSLSTFQYYLPPALKSML